ncbi:MAG TPA: hypothetical protein VKQ52_17180 [Puia sp.]|nr:hypothetical protein [Puia sp.]
MFIVINESLVSAEFEVDLTDFERQVREIFKDDENKPVTPEWLERKERVWQKIQKSLPI